MRHKPWDTVSMKRSSLYFYTEIDIVEMSKPGIDVLGNK